MPREPLRPLTAMTIVDALLAAFPSLDIDRAAAAAQAVLSTPPMTTAARIYNASLYSAIPLAGQQEMDYFHDLLDWSTRPDSPCQMDEETQKQYVAMRGTLCYVLGHEHSRDCLPATLANIERIMLQNGYRHVPGAGVVRDTDAENKESSDARPDAA